VLCRNGSWSFTLREEHRLKLFEKRVLRRKCGYEQEVTGWRKLHNEEFHNLYSSNIIRSIQSNRERWVKHVATIER
jgi:hypothetical protein